MAKRRGLVWRAEDASLKLAPTTLRIELGLPWGALTRMRVDLRKAWLAGYAAARRDARKKGAKNG